MHKYRSACANKNAAAETGARHAARVCRRPDHARFKFFIHNLSDFGNGLASPFEGPM